LLLVPPGVALEPEDEVSLLDGLALDELLDGELLEGELLDGELPMDELGAAPLVVDSAGEGDEAPAAPVPEPLSLADDPLADDPLDDDPLDDAPPDDAPPAAPPLAPALAPPPAPPPAPPAPPPCAHDTLARPNMAAVMAALISLSFIAWVPLGLGWDELRGHPRKNNALDSNGLCLQGFSAR
jgi:hypothetical protein